MSTEHDRHKKECNEETQTICEKIIGLRFELIAARLNGMDDALKLRTEFIDKRLADLNHLEKQARQTILDDRLLFVRNDVYIPKHEDIMGQIRKLQDDRLVVESKASQKSVNLTIALAVVAALVSVLALVLDFLHIGATR